MKPKYQVLVKHSSHPKNVLCRRLDGMNLKQANCKPSSQKCRDSRKELQEDDSVKTAEESMAQICEGEGWRCVLYSSKLHLLDLVAPVAPDQGASP